LLTLCTPDRRWFGPAGVGRCSSTSERERAEERASERDIASKREIERAREGHSKRDRESAREREEKKKKKNERIERAQERERAPDGTPIQASAVVIPSQFNDLRERIEIHIEGGGARRFENDQWAGEMFCDLVDQARSTTSLLLLLHVLA